MTESAQFNLRFTMNAQARIDAESLLHAGLRRIDLIVDAAAVIFGVVMVLAGDYVPGIALLILVAAFATLSQPFQRWVITRRSRSLIGGVAQVSIGDESVTTTSPAGSSTVPWTALTGVRSNSRVMIFVRDRMLLAYVPLSAFENPGHEAQVEQFAQARIRPRKRPARTSGGRPGC